MNDMESVTTTQNILSSMKEWQTLVGALIGVLVPMTVALLSYPFQKYREKKKRQREILRRIEIYSSQILNDIGDSLGGWVDFIDRLRDESTKKPDQNIGIFLTNIPLSVPILYDKKLIQEKTHDIVLHNFFLNLGKWVRGFNALLDEKQRSFAALQAETQSQISHARALHDSNPGQIMINYRQMLANYIEATEKSLCGSIRSGVEVSTIVKKSTEIIRKSNFGWKRFAYVFKTEYRDYKRLKKLSIENYAVFQDEIAQHFQEDFLKILKLYLDKTAEHKIQHKKQTQSYEYCECNIKKEVLDLYSITAIEKNIL
jgi:hypothetical protein